MMTENFYAHLAIKRAIVRAAVNPDNTKPPLKHTSLSGERRSSLVEGAKQHKDALLGRNFAESIHFVDGRIRAVCVVIELIMTVDF